MRRSMLAPLALGLVLLSGCSTGMKDDSKLTRAQRDSVIAKSQLPGAPVVGRALEVGGASARRAADLDSLAR